MDAIKRAELDTARERNFLELCARLGGFSTIADWEIAALMQRANPDDLDFVTNDQGDGVDLSYEKRMLISAVLVADLAAFPASGLPPDDDTHVAVGSLIPWLKTRGYRDLAEGLASESPWLKASTSAPSDTSAAVGDPIPEKPVQRFHAQESAILGKLVELGFDPCGLPRDIAGKRGVKSQVKAALGSGGLWIGKTVFDKAWERLLGEKRMARVA